MGMMPEEKLIRSFIAIPLGAPVKAAATSIQNRLKPALPEVRWTKAETMHLTLHFFGGIDHESLDKAGSVMVSIESLFQPFPMFFCGVGAFPSPGRARIFWLGIKSDALAGLQAELTQRLKEAGFAVEERSFRPHITLGRSRGGMLDARHILSPEGDTVAGEMTVERLVLFESELLPSGAIHRERQAIHFTAD